MFLFIWVLFSINAYAGEVGNGGDVVVCKDSNGKLKSIELLDVFEARLDSRNIDLGWPDDSPMVKIREALSPLGFLDNDLYRALTNEAKTFYKNSKFVDNIVLTDIPDSDELMIGKGCELQQIAINRGGNRLPGQSKYVISNDLWKLLDNDNKAALILHEIIYDYFKENFNHTNSIVSRYFNGYLFSRSFSGFFPEVYRKLNYELKLRGPEHNSSAFFPLTDKIYFDFNLNKYVVTARWLKQSEYTDSSLLLGLYGDDKCNTDLVAQKRVNFDSEEHSFSFERLRKQFWFRYEVEHFSGETIVKCKRMLNLFNTAEATELDLLLTIKPNEFELQATWTPSTDPDLEIQKVQFFATKGCLQAPIYEVELPHSVSEAKLDGLLSEYRSDYSFQVLSTNGRGINSLSECSKWLVRSRG